MDKDKRMISEPEIEEFETLHHFVSENKVHYTFFRVLTKKILIIKGKFIFLSKNK